MFDTSDAYGPHTNQQLVGRAPRGRRDGVVVATTFGAAIPGVVEARRDYASVLASCDDSLERLGIDHIDLDYQHRVDFMVPVEETSAAPATWVKAGNVRHIGRSEASVKRVKTSYAT